MKKIVRLTESDLVRLVKRIVKENEMDMEMPKKRGILGHKDRWYDEMDSPVNPDEFDYDEEIEFGPDDYDEYIDVTSKDHPENRWSFGDEEMGRKYWDKYSQHGPVKLRRKH